MRVWFNPPLFHYLLGFIVGGIWTAHRASVSNTWPHTLTAIAIIVGGVTANTILTHLLRKKR